MSRDLAIDVKLKGNTSRFLRAAPGEFLLKEALPTAFYNEIDGHAAQWSRNLIAANELPLGVVDERSIRDLSPADVASYRQCHFFAGLGTWSRALEMQDGRLSYPYGQGARLVNLGHTLDNAKDLMMKDISGQNGSDSSKPVVLLSSSENKSPAPMGSAGSTKVRICKECKIEKSYAEFYTNSKGGRRWTCIDCYKIWQQKKKSETKPERAIAHKKWRLHNRASALLTIARFRAKKRGLEFSITKEMIDAQLKMGVCALTGIPFNLDDGKTWDSPSIDRINPAKGYIPGNVRVVLYCVNVMMNIWGEDKILEISRAISVTRREREDQKDPLLGTLTERLKQRLEGKNSTLYSVTWKKLVTPAGRTVWQQQALARPIAGSASTSWPSPVKEDSRSSARHGYMIKGNPGTTLLDAARLAAPASYPTPQAHDACSAKTPAQIEAMRQRAPQRSSGGPPGISNLNEVVLQMGPAAYPTPNASCGTRGGGSSTWTGDDRT